MKRRALVLFSALLTALLFLAASDSRAQGPATPPPTPDAGKGESAYGCVETVPKGAERPLVTDTFPQRGTSGWAAALSITVRHGKGERVLPSGLDLSGATEAKKLLKDAGFAIPDQDGGAGARIWTDADDAKAAQATTHLELPLVLLPPNPGRNAMLLPPLPVAVARANGEIATVCTHSHGILVEDPTSNTPDAMPKGNPAPMVQREEWTALKRALGWSVLGLAIGAVVAILLWRKLTAPKPLPPPPPPRPAWEVALEELDRVRHAGLLEVHRYGEHFDRTSDAARRYLGARFGFDGLESTTDEILGALKKQGGGFIRFDSAPTSERPAFAPAPGVAFERVASFLRECDLVKFANLTPTPDQCSTSITTGEAIVRATMPTASGMGAAFSEPLAPAAAPPPPPEPPRPTRSPYEPPDPSEPAAEAAPEPAPKPEGAADEAPKRDPEGGAS